MLRTLAAALGLAVLLTWPAALHPWSVLIGDPEIDVWNHAWGYWFVAESLASGQLPYDTTLLGAPDGGVLYFIDMAGALAALPLTWIAGPAVGYNVVLIARVAMAGFAARLLARELTGPGVHTWFAGVAYATTPFLLCELTNGISEVCAVQWVPLTLWAAARALRLQTPKAWVLFGLTQGLTVSVTFYYGLLTGILTFLLVAGSLGGRWFRRREQLPARWWLGPLLAGLSGLVLMAPAVLAFKASVGDPRALIQRATTMTMDLFAHNAVDPRVFFAPGGFQSVDLKAIYDEPFVHTAYLRWVALLLAGMGVWWRRRLAGWAALAVVSMVCALGTFLWWDGAWLTVGSGMQLSLPFYWLLQVLPQISITHPLRLSVGAQAIVAVLAAGGLAGLAATVRTRMGDRGVTGLITVACLLVALEGMFGSAARWPIPTSSAQIPAAYTHASDGMVLDLPAEAGRGMETSRYFWHQTGHGRPIPYTPDARAGSVRDRDAFRTFLGRAQGTGIMTEQPRAPDAQTAAYLRRAYDVIVLHPELEEKAGLDGAYRRALTEGLGPPVERDGLLVWEL